MNGTLRRSDAASLIGRLAETLLTHDPITVRLDPNGNLWVGERLAATFQWEEEGPGTCPRCGRNVGQRPDGALNFHGNFNTGVCPGSHEKSEVTA